MHSISVVVPVKTQSENNGPQGMGFFAKAERRRNQRFATWAVMHGDNGVLMELKTWPRWRIVITRISPGTLDEGDNLRAALKSIRDEVTKCLGVGKTGKDGKFREDDSDGRLTFVYDQKKGPQNHYEVRVRFELEGTR
jgi:hypothetical protein